MANRFRTNILSLSGKDISIDNNDLSSFLRHDGTFQNPVLGLTNSGNLYSTGSILDNKINVLSGYSNTSFATIENLQSTGQQSWNASNNNSINLSGNLTQTGVTLGSKIDFLSGYVKNTSISVTGFSPAFTGNIGLSGLGNVTVFTGENNFIYISGAEISATSSSAGGGVTGLSVTGYTPFTGLIGFTGIGTVITFTGVNNNVIISGDTNYSPNNLGYLFFDDNMGQVAAFDANITGGQLSGTVNSYAFNVNGESIATVYSEYHSSTLPVRNASFNIHKNIGLNITGTTGGAFNFDDVPYYFHAGNIPSTGKLPSLASCTGRMYIIKCRGTGVLLTGFSSSEFIFNTAPALTLLINSGESYHIVNGGNFWDII